MGGMELFSEIWAAPHMSDLLPPGLGRGKMHVAVRSWLVLCTLIGCCGASGNVVFKADGPPSADLVNAAMPPHGQECHDIVNIKSDLTDQGKPQDAPAAGRPDEYSLSTVQRCAHQVNGVAPGTEVVESGPLGRNAPDRHDYTQPNTDYHWKVTAGGFKRGPSQIEAMGGLSAEML